MSELTLSTTQLDVVKRTIAKDCNSNEFDLFISAANRYRLDPFRRQITPVIFSKDDPKKRSMTIIMSRDGYRCIASRCGDYRPASDPAQFTYNNDLVSQTNPKGIVSVVVKLWKQDKKTREWFPVVGEADWDEFAPLKKEWAWNEQRGKNLPTGKEILDDSGQWAKMPKLMIAKCAESQALRAGWPEEFSGIYGEEEMAKAIQDDLTASQMAEIGRQERVESVLKFKGSVPVNFGEGIHFIEAGKYYDAWMAKINEHKDNPHLIMTLKDQNRECLLQFWNVEKDAALELKKEFEKIEKKIESEAA